MTRLDVAVDHPRCAPPSARLFVFVDMVAPLPSVALCVLLTPSEACGREMYVFALSALPSLSDDARLGMLQDHLLPALSRSAVLRPSGAPEATPDAMHASVGSEGGAMRGQQMDGNNEFVGGTGFGSMVLSVHSCVQTVLQSTSIRAELQRSAAQSQDWSLAGGDVVRANARVQTRQKFVNVIALLECFLLYKAMCARKGCVGGQAGGGEARGPAAPACEEELVGVQAFEEACGWQIEMPADLHADFSAVHVPTLDHMRDALRVGWSCYLNFAAGMIFCSLACVSCERPAVAKPSPMVLGRLVQCMQCRQHLQDVLLPFLAHCARVETRSSRQNRARGTRHADDGDAEDADEVGGEGAKDSWQSTASNAGRHGMCDECGQENEATSGSVAVESVLGSLTARAQALHDVCTGNWEVEVPSSLLCVAIAALEPHGLATQKALLEMLRLVNQRLRQEQQQHAGTSSRNGLPAMASQSKHHSKDTTSGPGVAKEWPGAARHGASVAGGMLQAWMRDFGLDSPLQHLSQKLNGTAVGVKRRPSNCGQGNRGGDEVGSGKGKEAMSGESSCSAMYGHTGEEMAQDSGASGGDELHGGDHGRRLAWQILKQCGEGEGDLLAWLGMQIAPLIGAAHDMRTGAREEEDDDAGEEQDAVGAEEDNGEDDDDEEWSASRQSTRRMSKVGPKRGRNGAKAKAMAQGRWQGGGAKRGPGSVKTSQDGKLSVCLGILGEIYSCLILLVRLCAHGDLGNGAETQQLSSESERWREIGTTLHRALGLGRSHASERAILSACAHAFLQRG